MAFNPQDYDVKPIGAAGLTERASLDGSERILVQAGADADVNTTPMQFFRYQVIKNKIDEIKGTGWAGQTVKGNADAIALRELLSNKKTTLADNSDTYFPTQKAVNDGLATKASTAHNHDDRYYTESEMNTLLLSRIYPVGAVYVQLAGQSSPDDIFTGTWEDISSSYAGLFFRAAGGNAASFGSSQAGGLPNITGSITDCLLDTISASGAFTALNGGVGFMGGSITKKGASFSAAKSNSLYGAANEVRPANSTIRIWKRTA